MNSTKWDLRIHERRKSQCAQRIHQGEVFRFFFCIFLIISFYLINTQFQRNKLVAAAASCNLRGQSHGRFWSSHHIPDLQSLSYAINTGSWSFATRRRTRGVNDRVMERSGNPFGPSFAVLFLIRMPASSLSFSDLEKLFPNTFHRLWYISRHVGLQMAMLLSAGLLSFSDLKKFLMDTS